MIGGGTPCWQRFAGDGEFVDEKAALSQYEARLTSATEQPTQQGKRDATTWRKGGWERKKQEKRKGLWLLKMERGQTDDEERGKSRSKAWRKRFVKDTRWLQERSGQSFCAA